MSTPIGIRIKEIRKKEKLTQAEFAELVDIPRITLGNYERGISTIKEDNLLKITNHPRFRKYALHLVCDWAAGLAIDPDTITAEEEHRTASLLLDSLSDEQIEELAKYSRFLLSDENDNEH